jgi:DNA-binding GntR family transcriptional regulator
LLLNLSLNQSQPANFLELYIVTIAVEPNPSTRVRSVERLHEDLRTRILNGSLPPGSVLSQVILAREFGVSRTPLREAMRRLEAEGLIESEQNLRARVRLIAPEELDVILTERILIETTGIKLSVPRFNEDDLNELHLHYAAMRIKLEKSDFVSWEDSYRAFHRVLFKYASVKLSDCIETQIERAERHRRLWVPKPFSSKNFKTEFEPILESCVLRDADGAVRRVARKLANIALQVLAQASPDYEPHVIRAALTILRADKPDKSDVWVTRVNQ